MSGHPGARARGKLVPDAKAFALVPFLAAVEAVVVWAAL